MPYIVDKKKKCIYKKNPDGSKGALVGCTKKSIDKYSKAIHVNVKEIVRKIVKEEINKRKNKNGVHFGFRHRD